MNETIKISLVTPTSDRPEAFRLCERWVSRFLIRLRESYLFRSNEIQIEWIVADGGLARIKPLSLEGDNTPTRYIIVNHKANAEESFRYNLISALERVRGDYIFFIEDDDWYAEDYLHFMLNEMVVHQYKIFGQGHTRYYDIKNKQYLFCDNKEHACLSQTGIRRELLPSAIEFLRKGESTALDKYLWGKYVSESHLCLARKLKSIGMKCLPGKAGLGTGHRLVGVSKDPKSLVLNNWVGEHDATIYQNLIEPQ